MGYGDEIIATGQARGLAKQGKRAAFGDGHKIVWHRFAEEIHQGNPNVAPPGSEGADDLVWIRNHPGDRPYNWADDDNKRWRYRYGTITQPGEIFLKPNELEFAERYCPKTPFVVVEPNVPAFKSMAVNKQWPVDRYQAVADGLRKAGYAIVQLRYMPPWGPGHLLREVQDIGSINFRIGLAVLNRAVLYVGPEGGLHHGAAALGKRAVVIFGGFISPQVSGYPFHENIYEGGGEPCGSFHRCLHCIKAMERISVDRVLDLAIATLQKNGQVY